MTTVGRPAERTLLWRARVLDRLRWKMGNAEVVVSWEARRVHVVYKYTTSTGSGMNITCSGTGYDR